MSDRKPWSDPTSDPVADVERWAQVFEKAAGHPATNVVLPDPTVVVARDERDRRIRDTALTATRDELLRLHAVRRTLVDIMGPHTDADDALFEGLTVAIRALRRGLEGVQ